MRLGAEPEHLHVFDAAHRATDDDAVTSRDEAAASTSAVEGAAGDGGDRAAARPQRREALLGSLLAPAGARHLRRLHLLSVPQELRARPLPDAAVPGAPETSTSASTSIGTCSRRQSSRTASVSRCSSRCSRCRPASCSASCSRSSRISSSRGSGVYRTIFSSTVATSVAVASVIFGDAAEPPGRPAPSGSAGSGDPRRSSTTRSPRLVAVSVVTIWQNLGLSFILMSAGLQAVPDDLLEAAEVDGASAWSTLLAT